MRLKRSRHLRRRRIRTARFHAKHLGDLGRRYMPRPQKHGRYALVHARYVDNGGLDTDLGRSAFQHHQVLRTQFWELRTHMRGVRGRHLPELVGRRSEEHTSELQSLMRISYAGFGLKTKKK